VTTQATGWSNAASNDGLAHGFNFILDGNAASTGFPSQFSPPNIEVWGPASGVNNGFSGSMDGGQFMGGDGAYGTSAVSQTINGLTAGQSYTLSFEWAGAQFTDARGNYYVGWNVGFGSQTFSTGTQNVADQGFLPWQNVSTTFTASGVSQLLSFMAVGGPSGLPPFSLLDGVSLTANVPPTNPPVTPPVTPVPEPEILSLLACGGLVLGAMARRRQRREHKA
jgi:hypothetical protein